MSFMPSFRVALRQAAHGAKNWSLVSAGVGVSLVILGRVLGVGANKAYGSAILLPFFLAACFGTFAVVALRSRNGTRAFDAEGRGHIFAAFVWSVICLLSAVAADWASSVGGFLGRGPNEFRDSLGMVGAVSVILAATVALPLQKRSDA